MKIFVISDTHGHLNKTIQVYSHLSEIDCIVHLGDLRSDAKELEKELGKAVISVPGNCDGSQRSLDYEILETEYGKLFLTHGHKENVRNSLQSLVYHARENDCKAALFGHTHIPYYADLNGFYLLNPGSLTLPRDGSQGSYAIINTTKSSFEASVIYYSQLSMLYPKESPKKTKVTGGYLKGLLNHSDRF